MQSAAFGWFEWVSLLIWMVWFSVDLIFPPPSTSLFKPLLMQATDSLSADRLQMLRGTIARIEGAYAPATIRAYFTDFAAFIAFCDLNNQSALPANAVIAAEFILHFSASGRSSASIRRAVVAIFRRPSFKSLYWSHQRSGSAHCNEAHASYSRKIGQSSLWYPAWSFEFTISKCGGLYQGITGWGAIATGLRHALPS